MSLRHRFLALALTVASRLSWKKDESFPQFPGLAPIRRNLLAYAHNQVIVVARYGIGADLDHDARADSVRRSIIHPLRRTSSRAGAMVRAQSIARQTQRQFAVSTGDTRSLPARVVRSSLSALGEMQKQFAGSAGHVKFRGYPEIRRYLNMSRMSLFSETVSIPVWLLLLMIVGMIPLFVKLYKLSDRFRRGDIVKEEHGDVVLWKLRTIKRSAAPNNPQADYAKEKSREKKSDILHVLKVMAAEGDKGMLLQSVADQMKSGTSKVQQAMQPLIDKKLVEEVVGVSGTKYYLTQLGKNYCASKGFSKTVRH